MENIPTINISFLKDSNKDTRKKTLITTNTTKIVLLPFTYSYSLAYNLLVKTIQSLQHISGYKIYIRNHPLLSKVKIRNFHKNINFYFYIIYTRLVFDL